MELDINTVSGNSVHMEMVRRKSEAAKASRTQLAAAEEKARLAAEQNRKISQQKISEKDVESYLKDILRMSSLFDRKLKFILNRDLNTVVVKVVDRETDKVIKEIPPEALQRLHRRMKEAIGLLIDQEI
jgi:flagellar protein FlaG